MSLNCRVREVHSMAELYQTLAAQLHFPAHFSANLDALYDCLTGDVKGPFTLSIENGTALRHALGEPDYTAFRQTLEDAAAARPDFTLHLVD